MATVGAKGLMFYFIWYVSLKFSKLFRMNDPLAFFSKNIFDVNVFKKPINSKCLKRYLLGNHKTCTHVHINNLTRTKISLTKYLLSWTKNHTSMPNCVFVCTNWSTTHPVKMFHRLPSVYIYIYIKKKNEGLVDGKN